MDFLLGPPFDIATMASNNLKPPIRLVTTAVVIEGISRGSVTWTNSFTLFAPSSFAASINSFSTCIKYCLSKKIANAFVINGNI